MHYSAKEYLTVSFSDKATMSSYSVGISRAVVSTTGYDGVSLRISTEGLDWALTTSAYETFGGR